MIWLQIALEDTIFEKSKPKKIQDNDTLNDYIKFGIYLSCINNDDQLHHKFLKYILKYFLLSFENDYFISTYNKTIS